MSKEVREILIKAGIALSAFLGTTLSTVAVKLLPPETLNKLDTLTWARLVVSTSLLSVCLIAWVIYLLWQLKKSKKDKKAGLRFINPPGLYKKKEGVYLCQPCLNDRDTEVELTNINPSGYKCRSCMQVYDISSVSGRYCPDESKELEIAFTEFWKK